MISSNKVGCPGSLVFKCTFFEFVFNLITFERRYKLLFPAYLSIPALISSPHKMPQSLDLLFYFRFRYSRGSPYSVWEAIFFWGTRTLERLSSLLTAECFCFSKYWLGSPYFKESIFTVTLDKNCTLLWGEGEWEEERLVLNTK